LFWGAAISNSTPSTYRDEGLSFAEIKHCVPVAISGGEMSMPVSALQSRNRTAFEKMVKRNM
jgi:hypothetical protein